MKTTNIMIITLVTVIFITLNFSSTSNAQILMHGDYLGQKLPKKVPVVFASGIISTRSPGYVIRELQAGNLQFPFTNRRIKSIYTQLPGNIT